MTPEFTLADFKIADSHPSPKQLQDLSTLLRASLTPKGPPNCIVLGFFPYITTYNPPKGCPRKAAVKSAMMPADKTSRSPEPAANAAKTTAVKGAIHYPFWFGGSASSMAACVTHPLDLGVLYTPSPVL